MSKPEQNDKSQPSCRDCPLGGCPHPDVCIEERERYAKKYGISSAPVSANGACSKCGRTPPFPGGTRCQDLQCPLIPWETQSSTVPSVVSVVARAVNLGGQGMCILDAPCVFCRYNGAGYWQAGTHATDCPFHAVGGDASRADHIVAISKPMDAQVVELCADSLRDKPVAMPSFTVGAATPSSNAPSTPEEWQAEDRVVIELQANEQKLRELVRRSNYSATRASKDAARYRFLRENDDFAYWLLEELERQNYVELELWQRDLDQSIDDEIGRRASNTVDSSTKEPE